MNLSKFKTNIYLRFGLIVLVGIMIPAFFMGYIEYHALKEDLLKETHGHITDSTRLLGQSLSRPMWELSDESVSAIVQSSFTDEEILKVKILDNENALFYQVDYSAEKSDVDSSDLFFIEAPIFHNAKFIGKVQVHYSVHNIYQTLQSLLMKFFVTRLIQLAVTLILVLVFINQGFLKRINRLSRQAKKLDMQILDEPFAWSPGDPINELGLDLENARQSLNELFNQVKDKNDELFKLNQELESKVKEKTQQVVHAARMVALGEMAAGVAHEINNPLTVIMATAKSVENGINNNRHSSEEIIQRLHKIHVMGERINKIVKGLRLFSGNTAKDEMQKVSLTKILNETLVLCQERLKNNNIKLYIVSIPDIEIECRSVEISQVLLNLINNASDAIRDLDQKWIAVEAKIINGMVEIKVTDSGTGIDSEIAGKIMQPFFTTKPVDQGTGLGLSISSGIIDDHNGRLWLDEEAKNTTFVLNVPVEQFSQNSFH